MHSNLLCHRADYPLVRASRVARWMPALMFVASAFTMSVVRADSVPLAFGSAIERAHHLAGIFR